MSNVNTIFLPWARQGLAARVANADPLSGALVGEARLNVALDVNGAPIASMPVRVSGPADVIGLDPRQVVRTEPVAGTADFESNNLASIEFDNPDLPWMFTPAAAGSQGRLRPWLCLVVVRKQPGVRLRPARGEPLPVLEIAPPAVPANEVPDLADSWAWAHAQLSAPEGSNANALGQVIATRPELSVSRLLSPRLLAPFTEYIACVVPAFDAGRRAGLGEAVDASAPLQPAWTSGAQAPAQVTLPVYFHWEFQTGAREDFESMVAKLVPRDLSSSTGRRAMDIAQPGFPVPQGMTPTVQLEGALQPVDLKRDAWPDGPAAPWQQTLQSIVNAANARSTPADAEPVLGPPIYGRWYARRHEVGTVQTRTWLDHLNLDPRERVVAALGTRVIQQKQEELMAQAWEQAGELSRVNQRLRQMQLSLVVTTRMHARHVARMNDDDALWRFASPAQSRLVWQGGGGGSAFLTMRAAVAETSTPVQSMSAAMRRLARPRGAVARRAATAIRVSGIASATAFTATGAPVAPPATGRPATTLSATAASTATFTTPTFSATTLTAAATATPATVTPTARVGNFFHVFTAQPQILIFIPPTRGLVSFDAVTRRLPQQHAGIVFARATNGAVASMPPRPAFTIGQPFVVTGGIFAGHVTGAVLGTRFEPTRARPRPGTFEPIEPREPAEPRDPIVRPTRPRPEPRPVIDSADAQAFREAAKRHLAIVNPDVPIVFVPLILKPALDAAASRLKVQALLDPAPAVMHRMAATIRVAESESAPRTVGPIGYSPTFPQPMSEGLAALSQDWLLPGLERVPPDTAAMLEPNRRFIEAFMLGLNVEMGRELLWRDYPEVDERATYFRRFWRAVDPQNPGDIDTIADWGERALGANGTTEGKQVVLLVRSGLFRRYPNAAVYAVPAVRVGTTGRKPGLPDNERHPIFRGSLQPDVSFFGFALDSKEAVGDPGWYFVIQEQPTEPRFGFDVEIDFGGAAHVPLGTAPAGHALPPGTEWARNSAHMARITRQQPVRVAIHASELLRS